MKISDSLSAAYGLARVGFGLYATSAPQRLGRSWIGEEAERPGTGVILRALGFRDIALGAGLVEASLRGDPRGWLGVSMLSDLGDLAATVIGRDRIGRHGVAVTSAVAGAGALAGAVLLLAGDSE